MHTQYHMNPRSLFLSLFLTAALTLQFVSHTFQEDHDPTIGITV